MISPNELQTAIAQSFFNGDMGIAGMIIYTAVMAFVFVALGKRGLMAPFAIMLPVTAVFTALGILPEALTVLLIIVAVLGLGWAVKERA